MTSLMTPTSFVMYKQPIQTSLIRENKIVSIFLVSYEKPGYDLEDATGRLLRELEQKNYNSNVRTAAIGISNVGINKRTNAR